jgi:hypothetical protein
MHAYPVQYHVVQLNAATPKGSGTDIVHTKTCTLARDVGHEFHLTMSQDERTSGCCCCFCNMIRVKFRGNECDLWFGYLSIAIDVMRMQLVECGVCLSCQMALTARAEAGQRHFYHDIEHMTRQSLLDQRKHRLSSLAGLFLIRFNMSVPQRLLVDWLL